MLSRKIIPLLLAVTVGNTYTLPAGASSLEQINEMAEQSVENEGEIFNQIKAEIDNKAYETKTEREEQERIAAEEAAYQAYLQELAEQQAAEEAAKSNEISVIFDVSFYTLDLRCVSNLDGITASGTTISYGQIALPSEYAFGSIANIDGLGSFVCTDRGSAVYQYYNSSGQLVIRVDVYLTSYEECIERGRYTTTGTIVLPE